MEFKVKVFKTAKEGSKVKAFASVTLAESFAVNNLRIVEGSNGLFVAMPSESYKDKDGQMQHRDIFFPITAEARTALQDAVLAEYAKA